MNNSEIPKISEFPIGNENKEYEQYFPENHGCNLLPTIRN